MSQQASEKKKKGLCRCFTLCWKSKKPPTLAEINKKKWKELGYKNEKQTLPPIFTILIDLYDGNDVYQALEDCRINPDYTPQNHIRNDLDYYIPQLTNFMMLHEDFANEKLRIFLDGLSKTDPYFAHLYYWYITSLLPDLNNEKAKTILNQLIDTCSSISQSHLFVVEYEKFYSALERKLFKEDYESKMKEMHTRRMKVFPIIQAYKGPTAEPPPFEELTIKGSDVDLTPYISPFIQGQEAYRSNPFTSTLLFFEDLYIIAEEAIKINDKLPRVKKLLTDLNKALPSCIYIPFVKDWLRHYAILNIVVDETRVFSTKERAPFYVCMELFCPKEELTHEYQEMFKIKEKKLNLISWAKNKIRKATQKMPYHKMERDPLDEEMDEHFKLSKLNQQVSSPLTLKKRFSSNDPNPVDHIPRGSHGGHSMIVLGTHVEMIPEVDRFSSPQHKKLSLGTHQKRVSEERRGSIDLELVMNRRRSTSFYHETHQHDILEEHKAYASKEINTALKKMGSGVSDSFDGAEEEKDGGDIEKAPKQNNSSGRDNAENSTRPNSLNGLKDDFSFFGEDSVAQTERIRKNSPFRDLKSWRLIHLIVKSGADIKEEQFALQLVSQFDQIFQAEKLKLQLTPYELVSLGPDIGVMEMLKDAVTLSSLKEKMYRQNIQSLNDFFIQYYGKDVDKARKRFCRSLAAYSLLCYFLQIKDRHNGNIMLHKQGNILHIDFGFFLSNAPGKGLEFERKVPFKLLNEYVEVLGGPRSRLFQDFRKLFFKGFMAARKHSDQIIILVKMMYSSQGNTLPCFRSGDRAILELERRFFPPRVDEKDLTSYCYNLINQSLDNWRAKCYDKYQYHFQGIFY